MWWLFGYYQKKDAAEALGEFQEKVARCGCLVEQAGRPVAMLTDPQYFDMFWNSWRIVPLTDEPRDLKWLLSDQYWRNDFYVKDRNGGVRFRSKADGQLIEFLVAVDSFANERLVLRGPYPLTMRDEGEEQGDE